VKLNIFEFLAIATSDVENTTLYIQRGPQNTSQLIFVCNLVEKSMYFSAIFTVRFINEHHMR